MAAVEQPGFVIEGKRYSFPESFRLGDPVLVSELTGMQFPEFAEALEDEERREDPAILVGLIGVAVWRDNPRWTRGKVVQYVQRIDLENFQVFGGNDPDEPDEPDEPEDEQLPPAPAIGPAPSNDSSTE